MSRSKRTRDQREAAQQQQQLAVEFSEAVCLSCGGPARKFSSTDVPAILGFVGGRLSFGALLNAARKAGFEGACYTSIAGISVCRKDGPDAKAR